MYAKHTVSIADTTITNYTVSADELHIFIADTIKRCGGIHYQSDVLDWNMEKLWKTNTLENYRLGKTKDAIQWSSTRTNRRDGKMFRKIADWASTESGKEVLTGVVWGIVGIIAVRLFCFLVCVVTGYPIN